VILYNTAAGSGESRHVGDPLLRISNARFRPSASSFNPQCSFCTNERAMKGLCRRLSHTVKRKGKRKGKRGEGKSAEPCRRSRTQAPDTLTQGQNSGLGAQVTPQTFVLRSAGEERKCIIAGKGGFLDHGAGLYPYSNIIYIPEDTLLPSPNMIHDPYLRCRFIT
jgi:hypothetical protein